MQACLRPSLSAQRRFIRRLSSSSSGHVLDELEARGLVAAVTSRRLREHLEQPRSLYLGVDPSAKSLHVGNLLALVGLLHFQLHGHRAIALVGGATGSIGDPSGRSSERTALERSELDRNVQAITAQMQALCDRGVKFAARQARMTAPATSNISFVDNQDWTGEMKLLDFLSGPGKLARVSTMLSRESVKSRLESKSGISFTEFSYQLLQAYDFYHLHKHHDCSIQLGGSDQWGNIQSGIELIRKDRSPTLEEAEPSEEAESPAYGLTLPLLTTASGEKFGKSAGNALWLDPNMTSPMHLYQFFLRSTDEDVERYFRMFSFRPVAEIDQLLAEHRSYPSERIAQKALAEDVTELVHGPDSLRRAKRASGILFGKDELRSFSAEELIDAFRGPRFFQVGPRDCLRQSIISLCIKFGVIFSKTQAKITVAAGGIVINDEVVKRNKDVLSEDDLIGGRVFMLRAGKSNFALIEVDEKYSTRPLPESRPPLAML